MNRENALRIARAAREFRDEPENLAAWLAEFAADLPDSEIARVRDGSLTPQALERDMRADAANQASTRQAHAELALCAVWDLALQEMRELGHVRTHTIARIAHAKDAPGVLYVLPCAENDGPAFAYRVERFTLREILSTRPEAQWTITSEGFRASWVRVQPWPSHQPCRSAGGVCSGSHTPCRGHVRIAGRLIRQGQEFRRTDKTGREKYLCVVLPVVATVAPATLATLERAS